MPKKKSVDGKLKERFVALDFETFNQDRDSVCAVGLAVIEDGKITDTYYELINPQTGYLNHFCFEAHGITHQMCKDKRLFEEVWAEIDEKYIKGAILIAHNAGFEKSCLRACAESFDTSDDYYIIDTLNMARQESGQRTGNRLNEVCDKFNIELENHHNALEDAVACANVFLTLREKGVEGVVKHVTD